MDSKVFDLHYNEKQDILNSFQSQSPNQKVLTLSAKWKFIYLTLNSWSNSELSNGQANSTTDLSTAATTDVYTQRNS